MTAIMKLDGIEIPNVKSMPLTPETICDESETAGRTLRRDVSRIRRKWKVTASGLSTDQRNVILNTFYAKLGGAFVFWLDEFGAEANAIKAYVDIENVDRQELWVNGSWGAYNIEMTITEQ